MHRFSTMVFLVVAAAVGGGCQSVDDPTAQRAMNNASVSAAVQARLTGDRSSDFTLVQVEAKDGMVTLTGAVSSVRQRARAEQLARQVEGVTEVNNDLHVRPEPTSESRKDE
ncbi:MAG TPA: BON domain-containing protein [Nitrospira sp.]|nr:BON domain-containing protein [Nitrospira sp.]